VNVDELSRLKDETLQKREAEVPRARIIIAGYIAEFLEWQEMRRHVSVLKAAKNKIKGIAYLPHIMRLSGESFPSRPIPTSKFSA